MMDATLASLNSYAELGYAIVPGVLSDREVDALLETTHFSSHGSTHERGGQPYANRQAHDIQSVRELATSEKVLALAKTAFDQASTTCSGVLATESHAAVEASKLGANKSEFHSVFAVRAILFDKVEGANWKIPWHQDITIAVRERHEVDGYGPWSIKEGLPHVQAPSHILKHMVAVRLHLDDCGIDNGPLRVVPKSHVGGRIKKATIPSLTPDEHSVALTCNRGDAILMSPLTLHASSPAVSANHRRVIHIEYACCDLDAPLEWARRIS